VIIVGERVNSTRPANQQALEARDGPALRAELDAAIIGAVDTGMMIPGLAARFPLEEDRGGTLDLTAPRQGRPNLAPAPPAAPPRA
jgi:hypothetical protein